MLENRISPLKVDALGRSLQPLRRWTSATQVLPQKNENLAVYCVLPLHRDDPGDDALGGALTEHQSTLHPHTNDHQPQSRTICDHSMKRQAQNPHERWFPRHATARH